MATFLEICQEVNRNIRNHGSFTSVSPTQPLQKNIVDAVVRTWLDLQKKRQLQKDMIKKVDFTTTASQSTYSFSDIQPLGDIDEILHIYYERRDLPYLEYEYTPLRDDEEASKPRWWTVDTSYTISSDDLNVIFNTLDDTTYDLIVVYRRKAQKLTAQDEQPLLEETFHDMIVYGATMRVASKLQLAGIYTEYARQFSNAWGYYMRRKNKKLRHFNKRFM